MAAIGATHQYPIKHISPAKCFQCRGVIQKTEGCIRCMISCCSQKCLQQHWNENRRCVVFNKNDYDLMLQTKRGQQMKHQLQEAAAAGRYNEVDLWLEELYCLPAGEVALAVDRAVVQTKR